MEPEVTQTPEVIEQTIANVLADTEPAEIQPEPVAEQIPEPVVEKVTEPSASYDPMWDIFKSKVSSDEYKYEIPDLLKTGKEGKPLTKEEEFDLLVDNIIKHVEIQDDDPFIAAYKAEKAKPDFDQNKFFESYKSEADIFELPSKEYLTTVFKRQAEDEKNGWTDDDINQYLGTKSKIELDMMASQHKQQNKAAMIEQARQREKENYQKNKEAIDQRVKDVNMRISSDADKLISKMITESSIGGVPHGQADIEEFTPFFKSMVSIDPATGKPPITQLLSNDETLYKAMYLLFKADKGAITDYKEKFKQDILNKTGLSKRVEGGTQRTVKVPTTEDYV